MRTVTITNLRQDATGLIDEVEESHEPVLVIQRSRAAAYVIAAADFEQMQRELRRLRHELFWHETDDARAEYRRGEARTYSNADELISDLALEPKPKASRQRTQRSPSRKGALAS